jgi:hypothetical protein
LVASQELELLDVYCVVKNVTEQEQQQEQEQEEQEEYPLAYRVWMINQKENQRLCIIVSTERYLFLVLRTQL